MALLDRLIHHSMTVVASGASSTRALAGQLGVSRGIVVEAYEQLVAECYLDAHAGGITRVARIPGNPPPRAEEPPQPTLLVDFRPVRPDVDHFPRQVWLRAMLRVLNEAPSERFGYSDGRGAPSCARPWPRT